MAAQRVDQLGSLAHEQVSGAEEHGTRLLLLRLHGDKPHGRPLCRFGDCLRIGGIVLLALHERLHIDCAFHAIAGSDFAVAGMLVDRFMGSGLVAEVKGVPGSAPHAFT